MFAIFLILLAATSVAALCPTAIECSSGCTTVSVPAGGSYIIPTAYCVAPAYMRRHVQAACSDPYQLLVDFDNSYTATIPSQTCIDYTLGSSSYTNEDLTFTCHNSYFACSLQYSSFSTCISSVWQTSEWSACTSCGQSRTATCVQTINGVATSIPGTTCGPSPALTQPCPCSSPSSSGANAGAGAGTYAPVSAPVASSSASVSIPIIVGASVGGVVLIAVATFLICRCRGHSKVVDEVGAELA